MPRTCTICGHRERNAIDAALIDRQSFRRIAAQFGVAATSLMRHYDDHLPAEMVQAARAAEVGRGGDLIDRLLELTKVCRAILGRSFKAENDEVALKAVARLERLVELEARLMGELQDAAPVVNITVSGEWLTIQQVIVHALDPYPEAKLAVAGALDTLQAAGHG
jgi:hypothetical protein